MYLGYAEHASDSGEGEHVHYNTSVYYLAEADKVINIERFNYMVASSRTSVKTPQTNSRRDTSHPKTWVSALVADAISKKSGAKANEPDTLGRIDLIIGMLICNDRRWPEAWRPYSLQGTELLLCITQQPGHRNSLAQTRKSQPEKKRRRKLCSTTSCASLTTATPCLL